MPLRACLLIAAALVAGEMPVTVATFTTGPKSAVVLKNDADQPVTAWSIAIVTPTASGTSRVVETIDAYLSEVTQGLPGSSPRTDRLMPRQSREMTLDPLPGHARVEVVAVVLDDRTAIGDPQIVAAIFDRRARERDELQAVVDAFNAVFHSKRGQAALEELRSRLAGQGGKDGGPLRAARDAVDTYLRQATADNIDEIDRLARSYASFVQRQRDLAVRHALPSS